MSTALAGVAAQRGVAAEAEAGAAAAAAAAAAAGVAATARDRSAGATVAAIAAARGAITAAAEVTTTAPPKLLATGPDTMSQLHGMRPLRIRWRRPRRRRGPLGIQHSRRRLCSSGGRSPCSGGQHPYPYRQRGLASKG